MAAGGDGQRRPRSTRATVVCACLLSACGADSSPSVPVRQDSGDDFQDCAATVATSVPGLRVMGEHLTVRALDAMPAEPEVSLNHWTVELQRPDGSPAAGAEPVRAETFMPVHGHDGSVQPRITALSAPGQFSVERLNFTMRGQWEVRLWLRTSANEDDYAVFDVCVAK